MFYFFLWWSGLEPRTLHILCIVHILLAKLTRADRDQFDGLL